MKQRLLCIAFWGFAACAARPPSSATVGVPAVAEEQDYDPRLLTASGVDAASLRCNRDNRWGSLMRSDAEAGAGELLELFAPSVAAMDDVARTALRRRVRDIVFWRMVRAVILEGDTNNLGVIPLRGRTYTEHGVQRPVLLFRTGLTPNPSARDSCFRSLLEGGHVRHVVNLFDGDIPAADLVADEQRAATSVGASYHSASDGPEGYGPWRDQLRRHYDDPAIRAQATQAVARLINEQILAPSGQPHGGNVHVHCGGGMHRTGMIVGILERCVNQTPWHIVEARYRYHVGWRSDARPGGLEPGNLRFIQEFDCSLLRAPVSVSTEPSANRGVSRKSQ